MLHVLSIVGARPQFVKAAVVSHAMRARTALRETMVHTGQHYDENMSQVFFTELGLPSPDHHLAIGSGPHGDQTGRMLSAIETVLLEERPDAVLVYGDTNSTLAGALAAAKLHIPVAHVEAGLRSFNRRMPEEVNRVLADHVSTWLFAPTTTAVRNLAAEGIAGERVVLVGDVMYDVALTLGEAARANGKLLDAMSCAKGEYILATVHRAENTDDRRRLEIIFAALAELATEHAVILPLHPRTRDIINRSGALLRYANALKLIEPVGYLDMVTLEANARLIITDSGGVQKEAYFHKVPCVTIREETEWVELVESGWNVLAPPTSVDNVVAAVRTAMAPLGRGDEQLYGSGDSASRISDELEQCLLQLQEA